ncbi:MAG TPA: DUF3488 and transglutaminase-like domain-containing protein [Bryobacteraceae bacterium]|nr:DUF3488 and transglutaminase-like domain-containing protein [Bryobacteraceae bacterium]
MAYTESSATPQERHISMTVRSSSASLRSGDTQPVERFFELSLLGLLASGYLAVVGSGFLDVPTAVITAAGLLLRGLIVSRVLRFEFSPRIVTALTLAYMGFYPLDYLYFSKQFLQATVHLVFFLAIVKILTAKTNRDYTYVKVIAFLELLAACILSTRFNFFAFLALFLCFGVATFASSEVRSSTQKTLIVARTGLRFFPWRLGSLTVFVFVGILGMTGGLFFLLPRTARAAFQHLVSQRYHLPGFSNEVVLGEIGEIKQQSTPVMHVRMYSIDAPSNLKWRGAALTEFDGRRWYNPSGAGELLRVERGLFRLVDDNQRLRIGRRIQYEVHLQDIAADTLFFAGTPEFVQINAPFVIRTAGGGYRAAFAGSGGLTYGVYSFFPDSATPSAPAGALSFSERENDLRLPPIDSRIPALARRMAAGKSTAYAEARAIEQALRSSYGYTLDLPKKQVADPLAYFLFTRKKGHCEYFASAMAVMLRTLRIPSRVVTGFQSGVYNPISGWQLIRASDAHSWVEAWLPNRGWTTFDPTPPDPNPPSSSLWSRLNLYVDAAETFWQDWVLNYDLDRQLVLASRMGQSSRNVGGGWLDGSLMLAWTWSRRTIGEAGPYTAGGVSLIIALLILLSHRAPLKKWWQTRLRVRKVQHGEATPNDATLLYNRMLALLKRRGIEKPAWLTPFEFARVLPAPELALVVDDLTSAYNDLRFGGNREAASRIMILLKRLEKL